MSFAFWIHALWSVGLVIQAGLVGVLFVKKVWKKFPLFAVFCSYSLLGDALGYFIAYFISNGQGVYTYAYPIYEAISIVLAVAVVYEIFTHLFSAHRALRKLAWLALCAVWLFLVLLGTVIIGSHSPIGAKGFVAAVLVMEEASRVIELGLILFLFVFSRAFGLHWRQNVFGIVLGLGISVAVKLAAVTIVSSSYTVAATINVLVVLTYDFSLMIWTGYLLVPERVTASVEMPKRAQLEQWNQAIMELIHQ